MLVLFLKNAKDLDIANSFGLILSKATRTKKTQCSPLMANDEKHLQENSYKCCLSHYPLLKDTSINVMHITPKEAVFLFKKLSYVVKASIMKTT